MPFCRLFYHFVWSTKNRQPIIVPDVESFLYAKIEQKCRELKGNVLALNGMPDHVHLVASTPPSISVSKFIGQVKGASSFYASSRSGLHLGENFEWQDEYGAFTVSESQVSRVIAYVRRQKEHHADRTLIMSLEILDDLS